jgi:hypothetical protein
VSQLIKGVGEIEASTDNKVVLFFLVSPFVELGKNKILCDAGGIMSGARRYCMSPTAPLDREVCHENFIFRTVNFRSNGRNRHARASPELSVVR